MTRGLRLVLSAVLLVLPFILSTSYAREMPISMKWAGTVTDTAINVDGDDFAANLIDAQAKGSFGASSIGVLSEFMFGGLCDSDPTVLYMTMWYSRPITTFANGDQLWGAITSGTGWMCLNVATGNFFGEAEGVFEGGTGRFAGATGTFTVNFGGKNLTLPALGVGFGAIHGELNGALVLP